MTDSVLPPPSPEIAGLQSDDDFITQRTQVLELPAGRVLIRPIAADDKDRLEHGLEALSQESRYRRFFAPVSHLTDAELAYLTELDYENHFAWGALAADEPGRPGIGVARYVRSHEDPSAAEAAVVVADDWQAKGIGGVLLRVLAETALQNGITRFEAMVLASNEPALEFMRRFGAELDTDESIVQISMPLPLPTDASFRDSALYSALRAAAAGAIEPLPEDLRP